MFMYKKTFNYSGANESTISNIHALNGFYGSSISFSSVIGTIAKIKAILQSQGIVYLSNSHPIEIQGKEKILKTMRVLKEQSFIAPDFFNEICQNFPDRFGGSCTLESIREIGDIDLSLEDRIKLLPKSPETGVPPYHYPTKFSLIIPDQTKIDIELTTMDMLSEVDRLLMETPISLPKVNALQAMRAAKPVRMRTGPKDYADCLWKTRTTKPVRMLMEDKKAYTDDSWGMHMPSEADKPVISTSEDVHEEATISDKAAGLASPEPKTEVATPAEILMGSSIPETWRMDVIGGVLKVSTASSKMFPKPRSILGTAAPGIPERKKALPSDMEPAKGKKIAYEIIRESTPEPRGFMYDPYRKNEDLYTCFTSDPSAKVKLISFKRTTAKEYEYNLGDNISSTKNVWRISFNSKESASHFMQDLQSATEQLGDRILYANQIINALDFTQLTSFRLAFALLDKFELCPREALVDFRTKTGLDCPLSDAYMENELARYTRMGKKAPMGLFSFSEIESKPTEPSSETPDLHGSALM